MTRMKVSVLALALGALAGGSIAAHAADKAVPQKPDAMSKAAAQTADAAKPTPAHKVSTETVDAYIKATFGKAPEDWQKRIVPDETMRACNQYRNEVPTDVADAIMKREITKVVYPADGKFLGDWKAGAKIANNGRGGQFSDKPDTINGGNCYACHQMAKSEVSFGTLGPSLTHYGKDRNYTEAEIKQAYTKIYNSQAVVPCSNMPRFGSNGFLSEQQIKDVMAFLFDPESPVNKE
ncbi:monoheme cytochrome SoxX (sulfur oxidation) [Rhodopseudomonas thermotolerans]|uniref:Monoheme cytochrome SoxX (Sulfur oxidation) n=2 Tax=Rhodopseudomonas TaxID=1073 RepID=A0A336JLT8_9BRAD|nr:MULTISPECIES: sulfur oxidation c-type cytochrome SoxX [Rhodopseudomonas]RED36117.1 monoheme cytochrome SoxX (sulfur oxidation) [Rhodopseudomonas pentothenatexigens]REG03489.1 monoheme cytochrome SoxX (sulfur oxidation) [Rhodopseudomonas thermotolerans]SSW90677.1 monoheme cytochrome SoxX (sulfur oxidation) [Rhodopseudomonas pentothenatexigens]